MAEAREARDILDELKTPISGVAPHQIQSIMHRLVPLLQNVVKPATGHTVEAVLHELLMGETLLWVIGDFKAITITRIQERPTGRVLWNEWLTGTDMDSWVGDWLTVQDAFARHSKCEAIEFAGRNAYMRRYLPTFNKFRAIRTIYRCEL